MPYKDRIIPVGFGQGPGRWRINSVTADVVSDRWASALAGAGGEEPVALMTVCSNEELCSPVIIQRAVTLDQIVERDGDIARFDDPRQIGGLSGIDVTIPDREPFR
jgi:hypothetical protein